MSTILGGEATPADGKISTTQGNGAAWVSLIGKTLQASGPSPYPRKPAPTSRLEQSRTSSSSSRIPASCRYGRSRMFLFGNWPALLCFFGAGTVAFTVGFLGTASCATVTRRYLGSQRRRPMERLGDAPWDPRRSDGAGPLSPLAPTCSVPMALAWLSVSSRTSSFY